MKSNVKIVLGILFFCIGGFFLLGGIGLLIESSDMAAYGTTSYCTAEVTGVERTGEIDEEYLLEGYTPYEITFYIENQSSVEHYKERPNFYFDGEEYGDVEPWQPEPEYGEVIWLFDSESEPYLPGGRSLERKEYVQVKDGVKEIRVTYSPNYRSEEESIIIEIP